QIIANIDWLIGEPLTANSFRPLTSSKQQQRHLFEAFKKIDVVAPPLLGNDKHDFISLNHRIVQCKFGIGRVELGRALGNDDGRVALSGGGVALKPCLALPTRMDFWHRMEEIGAFFDIEHVYYVGRDALEAVELRIGLKSMFIDDTTESIALLYSNRALRCCGIYFKSDIDEFAASDSAIAESVRTLVDNASMELDLFAKIDMNKLRSPQLLQFESFTRDQFKMHFDFDDATCSWILNLLIRDRVVEIDAVPIVKLVDDWIEKAEHFEWTNLNTGSDYEVLEGMEKLTIASAINPTILQRNLDAFRDLPNEDGVRVVQDLFEARLDQGLSQMHQTNVYRQAGPLNCSMLPATLASPVLNFLSHHFAYTFAREVLWNACIADSQEQDSTKRTITTKKVMLSEDAHQEMFEELCRLEIIAPSRITSRHFDIIDYIDFPLFDKLELEHFIYARRLKLRDDIQMFKLVSFVELLEERETVVTGEMEALIDLGMPAGVSLRKLSTAQKIGGALSRCFRFLVDNRQMLMKGITFAIGVVLATKGLGEVMGGLNTDVFGQEAVTFIAAAGTYYQQIAVNAPREATQAMHNAASAVVRVIEGMQRHIAQLINFTGAAIMGGVAASKWFFMGGINWLDQTIITRVTGTGIHECMSHLFEKCRALFGSYEYYHQCRMATHNIAARAPANDTKDEYRIIRMFDSIGSVADEQSRKVNTREQELIDQTINTARRLKTELIPPSTGLFFTQLSDYLSKHDNYRWFKSELILCIQWAAMEALRKLTETGRVDKFDYSGLKCSALAAAYLTMCSHCKKVNEYLDDTIADLIELEISEMFTNPVYMHQFQL
ncbi:hypothetical protein PENTCL1PPCAC_9086, partial [Pristionchus entomophagus]